MYMVNMSKFSTYVLVKELRKREGVESFQINQNTFMRILRKAMYPRKG